MSRLADLAATAGACLFVGLCFGAYVCGRVFCSVDERGGL